MCDRLSDIDIRFKQLRSRDREKAFDKWVGKQIEEERAVLKAALIDIPEIVLQATPKDMESIPKAVCELEQWKKMESITTVRWSNSCWKFVLSHHDTQLNDVDGKDHIVEIFVSLCDFSR